MNITCLQETLLPGLGAEIEIDFHPNRGCTAEEHGRWAWEGGVGWGAWLRPGRHCLYQNTLSVLFIVNSSSQLLGL